MSSYHYKECGLDNVYLVNGFTIDEDDGEEYVSIEDTYGLHKLIARQIVSKTAAMTGAEYRFLRIEMNMSQKTIGELFGVDTQTVARWEKGKNELPKMADVLIRAFYTEFIEQESKVRFLVDAINENEAQQTLNMSFEQNESGWHIAAQIHCESQSLKARHLVWLFSNTKNLKDARSIPEQSRWAVELGNYTQQFVPAKLKMPPK